MCCSSVSENTANHTLCSTVYSKNAQKVSLETKSADAHKRKAQTQFVLEKYEIMIKSLLKRKNN